MTNYFTTTEQQDVLISLREVLAQLTRTEEDIHCWKWAVIALACAVNGALTCNLSGTMKVGALRRENCKKTIAGLQRDSETNIPDPWLAAPDELLCRSQEETRTESSGQRIIIDKGQQESFRLLFKFRDQFVHFKPCRWIVNETSFPLVFADVLAIIRQTAEDDWSFRRLAEPEKIELDRLLEATTIKLQQIGGS